MKEKTKFVNMHMDNKFGIGVSPGTFGEILQGMSPNGKNFLVSIPIKKFSYAKFLIAKPSFIPEIKIFPATKIKALKMAKLVFDFYSLEYAGEIHLTSEIPEGKGLASSSADLVATARAIQNYFNLDIPNNILGSLMRLVEPSNAVMYNEVVSYYYKDCVLHKSLGVIPKLSILGVDEGGVVKTLEFNNTPKHYTNADKQQYEFLLSKLEKAIQQNNLLEIGEVATASAILHQKHKQNRNINLLIDINNKVKGLGVVIAHSGTYIGILFDQQSLSMQEQIVEAKKEFRLAKIDGEISLFSSYC